MAVVTREQLGATTRPGLSHVAIGPAMAAPGRPGPRRLVAVPVPGPDRPGRLVRRAERRSGLASIPGAFLEDFARMDKERLLGRGLAIESTPKLSRDEYIK